MSNITDMIFLIHLIGLSILTIARFYNIVSGGALFPIKDKNKANWGGIWALSISSLILWLFGLMVVLMDYSSVFYAQLFRLSTFFILLNLLFLVIEIFIGIKTTSTSVIDRYSSNGR